MKIANALDSIIDGSDEKDSFETFVIRNIKNDLVDSEDIYKFFKYFHESIPLLNSIRFTSYEVERFWKELCDRRANKDVFEIFKNIFNDSERQELEENLKLIETNQQVFNDFLHMHSQIGVSVFGYCLIMLRIKQLGNGSNAFPSVYIEDKWASDANGGFEWDCAKEGHTFWEEVFTENIETIDARYQYWYGHEFGKHIMDKL